MQLTTRILLAVLVAWLIHPQATRAAVLGNDALGPVLVLDNSAAGTDDHIDGFDSNYNSAALWSSDTDAAIILPGSSAQGASSITDSNTPGIAYSMATTGELYRVDYFRGTANQVAVLTLPPVGPSSGHTTFDSITNLPGSNLLYVLRTGSGSDYVDTYNPATGIQTHEVFVSNSGTGGAIAISDGPAYQPYDASYGPGPSLYLIATGGNFDVLDPTLTAGNVGKIVSGGSTGLDSGNLVSITNLPGDDQAMWVLQDRTGAVTQDAVHRFLLDGTRQINAYSVVHTGASSITDAYVGFLYTEATGGSEALIDTGTDTVHDLSGQPATSQQSVTNVAPLSSPRPMIYIADDQTANHTDVFDARYRWEGGMTSNAYASTATATGAPASGTDHADSAVTDAWHPSLEKVFVWQLHTDGELFRVDPDSGAETLVRDFDPTGPNAGVLTTYESVTNLGFDGKLYILRTDRPENAQTGGGANDVVDVYDIATDTYLPNQYQTAGTGGLSITDGPDYSGEDGSFSAGEALYIIANGGSFEVLDPRQPGLLAQIRSGRAPGDSSGDFMSVTDVPGIEDALFVLRNRKAGDGTDRVDIFYLDGTAAFDALNLGMTGAVALTDTFDGNLFATATGGASAVIELNRADLLSSTVFDFNAGSATYYVDATNLQAVPEPATILLLVLGGVGIALTGRFRRRPG